MVFGLAHDLTMEELSVSIQKCIAREPSLGSSMQVPKGWDDLHDDGRFEVGWVEG